MKRRKSVQHLRGVLPGDASTGLRKRVVEQRGIFTSVLNIYDNPAITAAELALNYRSPVEILNDLWGSAEAVLRAAGEKSYIDALAAAPDADETAEESALRDWHYEIGRRKGELSREGIAAGFLFAMYRVSRSLGNTAEAAWEPIVEFAIGWHRFALDHSGTHDQVVEGLQTRTNLTSGSRSRAVKKDAKLADLLKICDEKIWHAMPEKKNNAYWASRPAKLKIINADLAILGHGISRSAAGMEKLIQEAIKRSGRRQKE